jgi:hypothetical protein
VAARGSAGDSVIDESISDEILHWKGDALQRNERQINAFTIPLDLINVCIMADTTFDLIAALHPRQFENLTYECLRALGMKNLVWRTPGSDGGRDIEGYVYLNDMAGFSEQQKWFVECKRYKNSISWPTVWEKIAYAVSNDVDILLVSTTSNPSPQCENEISKWNLAKRRPVIRFWRGYDLANLVRSLPHIGGMFGLSNDVRDLETSLLPLAQLVAKTANSAYTRIYFSASDTKAIETTASISELFAERLRNMREFGHPVPGFKVTANRMFDWLSVDGDLAGWEDVPLRAMISFLSYEFHARSAHISGDSAHLIVKFEGSRGDCADGLPTDRDLVSFWSKILAQQQQGGIWKLEKQEYV